MKKIVKYVQQYYLDADKRVLFSAALFLSVLIFLNYHYGINERLENLSLLREYAGWFAIFLTAFSFAHILQFAIHKTHYFRNWRFIFLLLLAPAIFAWKMIASIEISLSNDAALNEYWNKVVYWPIKLAVIILILFIVWKQFDKNQPFYGLSTKGFNLRPYLWMLLCMIPLIAIASTQQDFLMMYPKLNGMALLKSEKDHWLYRLIYELSYGTDFLGIELFFRGFLILAFAKWMGKDAILPMALFYCTIHFGKPLGECISSFFGGLLLGVVTYHTRSIWGGLVVHLGIAWLMELGGYIGSLYFT